MGRHVVTTSDNDDARYWFKATVAENKAWQAGSRVVNHSGRHVAPSTCQAYVLVAGAKHPCVLSLAEHKFTPRHEHPLYGKWENAVYDLDKYRKRFVR